MPNIPDVQYGSLLTVSEHQDELSDYRALQIRTSTRTVLVLYFINDLVYTVLYYFTRFGRAETYSY